MRQYLKPNLFDLQNPAEAWKLLARVRQDQLEAALAGRIDESAFFAGEARALRQELEADRVPQTCA